MAKVRIKVMENRHSPKSSRDRKQQLKQDGRRISFGNTSSSRSSSDLPPIPYIRCGFLQGKAPKVRPESFTSTKLPAPQSPVNSKAADISFPASPGLHPLVLPSTAEAPRFRKWLTLGCDPCKQHRRLFHEDYKLQPRTPPLAPPRVKHSVIRSEPQVASARRCTVHPSFPASSSAQHDERGRRSPSMHQEEQHSWEQEMSWRVLAKSSGNKVVRKQVVLKKRSASISSASASISPIKSPPLKQHDTLPLRFDEMFLESNGVVGAAGCSSSGYVSARNSCDSRSGAKAELGVYKLTTASPDENDSYYAWEDLSPFASESSCLFTSFDSPSSNLPFRRVPVSPDNRRLFSASKPSGSIKSWSPARDEKKRSPKSRLRSSSNWTSPSRLLDEIIDSQKDREDPEAACRSWDGFQLQFEKETCTWKKSSRQQDTTSCRHKGVVSLEKDQDQDEPEQQQQQQEQQQAHLRTKKHRHQRRVTSSSSKVAESVAVEKFSFNPYSDFRESMIDMILKKELFQHRDLEELLKSYLALNRVELHGLITRVFTDLWYHLFSIENT